MISTAPEFKVCTGPCKRVLRADASNFHAAVSCKGGLNAKCKDCVRAQQRAKLEELPLEERRARSRERMRRHRAGVKLARPPLPSTKTCPRCERVLDRKKDFYQQLHHGQLVAHGHCKPCAAEYQQAKDWAVRLCSSVKHRHIARWPEEPFDLSPTVLREQLEAQGGLCAWFRVPLDLRVGGHAMGVGKGKFVRRPDQVSIDRIDVDRGYTRDNILIVSQAANLARCNTPIEIFEDFARAVRTAR